MPNAKEYFKMKQGSKHQEDYERRLRSHRRSIAVKILFFFAVLVVFSAIIYVYNQNKVFSDYRVVSEIERKDAQDTKYMPYGNYIVQFNSDGISCLDKNNKQIWNQTFEMKSPQVDICETYVAVCDEEGNRAYILDKSGLKGEVATQLPIKKIQVANQGVIAVLMKDGDVNRINYYDKEGDLLTENKSPVEKSGFPIDIALSNDGMKLAVSYMFLTNGTVQSKLAFYNFDSVGENEIDHLVSATDYDGSVIPQVDFVNANTAVVFGSNFFGVYQGTQKPVSVFEKKLENEVKSVFYSEKYMGLVFEDSDTDYPYRLEIYNMKGSLITTIKLEMIYDRLQFNDNMIFVENGSKCAIYSVKGKLKYKGDLEEEIVAMIPMSDRKLTAVLENKKQVISFR